MNDKEEKNIPKEPGFYWAKSCNYQWYNLIVWIYGDVPYLQYEAWNRGIGAEILKGKCPDDFIFGPKIEEP